MNHSSSPIYNMMCLNTASLSVLPSSPYFENPNGSSAGSDPTAPPNPGSSSVRSSSESERCATSANRNALRRASSPAALPCSAHRNHRTPPVPRCVFGPRRVRSSVRHLRHRGQRLVHAVVDFGLAAPVLQRSGSRSRATPDRASIFILQIMPRPSTCQG